MVEALPLHPDIGKSAALEFKHGGFGAYDQFCSEDGEGLAHYSTHSSGGLWVVCTAELYNLADLEKRLQEAQQSPRGEAAAIAALYRRYGLDFLRYLDGVFALALWDENSCKLLLATDPFSVRPLYYHARADKLIFASRINAVLQDPTLPRSIDPNAIYQYLYYSCIPTPNTVYEGIKKLPPGHYLLFSESGLTVAPYWDVSYQEDRTRSVSHFAPALRERLTEAIRSQIRYDTKRTTLGSFLSGGTDSSTITGLLARNLQEPVKSFSIGFHENPFNEIAYARIAANHFHTDHHEYFVTPEDTLAVIPKLVQAYDEPYGNASAVPAFYCAREARQHGVAVLFAGDGGDELFGGNARYADDRVFQIYHLLPSPLRTMLLEPALLKSPLANLQMLERARKYLMRATLPLPKRFLSYHLFYTIDPRQILTTDFLTSISNDPGLSIAQQHYDKATASCILNRWLYLDLKLTIADNDLRKVSRMCEVAGVKVRYPMLDRNLVELSATLPAWMKVRRFEKRYIFKKAFQGILPHEILTKKKHGFGLPISPWLRDIPILKQLAQDTLLSQQSIQRGYFRPEFLRRIFQLHAEDNTNFFGDNLWVFLMLELWHQSHV